MKKWTALVIVAVVAAVAGAWLWRTLHRGPNVLLITLDTTRSDRLGCYGYAGGSTPALDSLAADGVRFTRARCNVPLTLPSHTTMMTGLYPPEHGCRVNGTHALAKEIPTFAEAFAARGYRTAAFVAAFVLDRRFGLDRGFGTYDQYEVPDEREVQAGTVMYRYRRGDKVADAALAWLGKNSGRPFFCWVHFFDPHRPYYVPKEVRDIGKAYDLEVSFMDRQVGRILEYLESRNLRGRTIVIAMGDHGEGLGDHGEEEHGLLLYDSVMRVPLIVSRPGRFPPGLRSDALVSSVDLLPTVFDLLGWKPAGRVSGRSFAPALAGKPAEGAPCYGETEFPLTEYGWSPLRSLTRPGWKYIDAPREELYDLEKDPGEDANLFAKDGARAKEMEARLALVEKGMTKAEASKVATDEAGRRALESLGYLGGVSAAPAGEGTALRDPKDAVWMRVEFIRAADMRERGDAAGADGILRRLIGESPESYAFRYALGKTLFERGLYAEALPEFEEMARRTLGDFRAHYNLGKTLIKLGRYDRAIGELKAAVTLDGSVKDGYNNLGLALLGAGRADEAIAVFKQSIALDPKQTDPHNNMGNALLALGRLDEAGEEFGKAAEADPGFFEGRYNIGLVRMRQGRYEEAADAFGRASVLRPGFAEAHRNLGLALTRLGKVREGLQEIALADRLSRGQGGN